MLIDVFDALENADDLPPRKRREMRSALKTLGRVLGDESLTKIPTNISSLNRLLANASPAAFGISNRRWQNVLSLVRAALARTQRVEPGRRRSPPAPEWAPLYAQLNRSLRGRLSRLIRYLSDGLITPESVTAEHISEFMAMLEGTLLDGDVHKIARDGASAWRAASRTIAGWPQIEWSVPSRRRDWTLPAETFPETFRRDLEAYLADLSHDDPLDDGGYRRVSPRTIQRRRFDIMALASALVLCGRPASSISRLADLVEPEVFKAAVQYLLKRRSSRGANRPAESSYIADIVRSFLYIARHWVRCSPEVLKRIQSIHRRVRPKETGLTKKNDERLRQFDTRANCRALVQLPAMLMRLADSGKMHRRAAALVAQLAVAIEIELLCPMRLKNLVALTLDQLHYRNGKIGMSLHIPGEQVKNHHPIDLKIPESTRSLIEGYLKIHWRKLAKLECPYLFPGRDRLHHKIDHALAAQIQKSIKKRLCLDMNVHLFRHFSALILLRRYPGQFGLVALLLGHTSERTTRRYYARFEQEQAFDVYDSIIDEMRSNDDPEDPTTEAPL